MSYLKVLFSFLTSNVEYPEESKQSGTTAVVGVIRGDQLYVINIGDSRIFYAYLYGDSVIRTESIAVIHCPDHDEERRRIEQFGGHVRSIRGVLSKYSTPRVYLDEENSDNGLAMSRSVGDIIFHKMGVISEPDFYTRTLDDNSVGILIGSDGLLTSFGMDHCFRRIISNPSPIDGLYNLISECYWLMMSENHKEYVDDISGVFIQFKEFDPSAPLKFEMVSGSN